MREFAKPVIYVSKCLGFAACRYNGVTIPDEFVARLKPYVEYHPVCPEVEIGLGVPRDPIRVVVKGEERRLVQPSTGHDVTREMNDFARALLDSITVIHGYVLKGRSPSCGIKDVKLFDKPDAPMPHGKGAGLFGAAVLERFPDLPVEDEGRLTNFRIREHFLTRIFTLAAFDEAATEGSMRALVRFHSENKLLLHSFNQRDARLLGKLAANLEKRPLPEVWRDYRSLLARALARPARPTANINVLQHALGYFSDPLNAKEKRYFLDTLDAYRAGKLPLSVPQGILRAWILRFDEAYLASQTFFDPYPDALVDITDSGKGRDG